MIFPPGAGHSTAELLPQRTKFFQNFYVAETFKFF